MRPNTEPRLARVRTLRLLVCLAVVSWLTVGCGPAQLDSTNRDLILVASTAASSRDPARIQELDRELQRRQSNGTLTADQRSAFEPILDASKAGDWSRAQQRALALRDAQKPTQEDLDRLARRTLREPKPVGEVPGAAAARP